MSNEIRIKSSSLYLVVLGLTALVAVVLALQIPDIRREIRLWTM